MGSQVKEKRPPKKAKIVKVDEIKEKFDKSKVVVLTEYAGLSVTQLTSLRKELRKVNAEYKVYKNTLANIGLKGKEIKEIAEMLSGPNAFLFGYEDPVMPVKILSKFIKENEKPAIKGGLLDSEYLDNAGIIALSKLPSTT